ncbi:MAG TPA: EVE domain-containing protein [Candidatus Thermoplasmatota archaeon]|nr:EVE domain-containing protein [Candidatus Thermoplasmatota archaeon]
MPSYWLAKSEPDVYSIDDLARDKRTFWNGVRNHRARNILRDEMKKGDLVLFYHSNAKPSAVVGIARVASEAKPDPTQFDKKLKDMGYDPRSKPDAPTWWGVDLEFVEKLSTPVTLADIKASPKLKEMALVRISQLSVQPVTAAEWNAVMALAGRT